MTIGRWVPAPLRRILPAATLYGAVFLLAFTGYSSVVLRGDLRPFQGDEPHYLLTTISIIEDSDINLRNQYDSKQWREFVNYELPDEHCVPPPPSESCLPTHNVWFSALLAPFYALGGSVGVIGFLLVLSAAVPVLMVWLIDSLVEKPFWPGRILAGAAAFSAPLTSASGTLYPSVLGAVLVLAGSILFVEATKTKQPHLLVISAVPWALTGVFHHAYFLLSFGFLMCLFVVVKQRIPKGVLIAYAVVYGGWLAMSFAVGGNAITGAAPGGLDLEYLRTQVSFHLFDKVHGLLTNAPVVLLYLASWPVVYWLRGRLPSFGLQFLFVTNSVSALTLVSYCFTGITPGESSISRYFVPIIPLVLLTVVYLGYHLVSWLVLSAGAVGLSAVIGAMPLVTGCRVTSCHPWIEERVSSALGYFDPLVFAGNFESWSLVAAYFATLALSGFVPLVLLARPLESFPLVQEPVRPPASAGKGI